MNFAYANILVLENNSFPGKIGQRVAEFMDFPVGVDESVKNRLIQKFAKI